MDVLLAAWVTSSVVDPVEAAVPLPEYVPNTRSLPSGAADELQDPLPLDNVAVHSGVDPVENVTEPLEAPVTEAEYVADVPKLVVLAGFVVTVVRVDGCPYVTLRAEARGTVG